ncbi:MAG: hypothetical protein V4511_03785 [Bacteroidota bacterium]
MNLRFLFFCIANFLFSICFSQDIQSLKEIRQILRIDLAKLDDTLAQKGFIFDKTEGLVFKYKKITSSIAVQTSPKEITYSFYDRKIFLKINSDLAGENFQLVSAEEDVAIHNQVVKASHFKKSGESVFLWSMTDESTKKTVYSIKMQQDVIVQNIPPPVDQKTEYVEKTSPNVFSALSFIPLKQKDTPVIQRDSSLIYPKPYRFHFTLAQFRFIDPEYGATLSTNIQFGFQKSSYSRKIRSSAMLSDIGYEIEFSVFTGMDYGWRSDPSVAYSAYDEYISLTKYYLGYNRYLAYNIKFADLIVEGGAFLNYNRGVGKTGSAGFMTSGIHLGEHIRRYFGKSIEGHPKMFIGVGFDQYIAFRGGYIGSFGVSIGF